MTELPKRALGRTGLQVTMLGYGAMELRGAPRGRDVTEAQAEKQKEHLRSRYDLIENLTDTFGQLALAEFRGFSILQKHRFDEGPNDGAVREFHWLPQYTWSRDGQFGDWYFNSESRFGVGSDSCQASLGETNRIGSVDLPRETFIIREVDTPLYEIALIAFVNWSMARKDWAAFVEIFGLPASIVILFEAEVLGGQLAAHDDVDRVAFLAPGEIPFDEIAFDSTRLLLQRWVEELSTKRGE